jgi:hypothetical protein
VLSDCYGLIEEKARILPRYYCLVEKVITNCENSLHAFSDKYIYSFSVMRRVWEKLSEKNHIISQALHISFILLYIYMDT